MEDNSQHPTPVPVQPQNQPAQTPPTPAEPTSDPTNPENSGKKPLLLGALLGLLLVGLLVGGLLLALRADSDESDTQETVVTTETTDNEPETTTEQAETTTPDQTTETNEPPRTDTNTDASAAELLALQQRNLEAKTAVNALFQKLEEYHAENDIYPLAEDLSTALNNPSADVVALFGDPRFAYTPEVCKGGGNGCQSYVISYELESDASDPDTFAPYTKNSLN